MSGAPSLHRHDPSGFFERCDGFLNRAPAEHNLILGLAPGLVSGRHDYDAPLYLASIEIGDEVVGYAFRTPPYKLGVSSLPATVVPTLVDDVGEVYDSIPAVMGPRETAALVARTWAARHGCEVRAGQKLRIHALTAVADDLDTARGLLRPASHEEEPLIRDWLRAFEIETGIRSVDATAAARRMIQEKQMFVWVDDEPTSMVAAVGATPTGMRVGYVYTPPRRRGHGYASAAVAELSRRTLAGGRPNLYLYTDLANPISNRIYARIGYEPVADVCDFEFVAPEPKRP